MKAIPHLRDQDLLQSLSTRELERMAQTCGGLPISRVHQAALCRGILMELSDREVQWRSQFRLSSEVEAWKTKTIALQRRLAECDSKFDPSDGA
jgi:hypothetical protein